jgi:hypothetical protein
MSFFAPLLITFDPVHPYCPPSASFFGMMGVAASIIFASKKKKLIKIWDLHTEQQKQELVLLIWELWMLN